MSEIATQLEATRKRLVETGTRNRLIHVNRSTKRGNLINVVNEKSNEIFKILKEDSKRMKFLGVGIEQDEVSEDDILLAISEEVDETRYTDLIIETDLTPDALQKRLLKISSAARTSEEEQGLNILYLAIGFLRWYEDEKSEVLRESPLILLPVELVRNAKTSTLDLVSRDEDIVTNLPLQERLYNDFGIELPEIEEADEWSPAEYFNKIESIIGNKGRWSVDHDGMQLGFFSFAKLLMLRDLDPENWTLQDLTQNHIIDRLLVSGFRSEEPVIGQGEKIDEVLDVKNIFQVIDADSSQTKVIEEVNSGKNLVVQGPPGTGKSQTITNILAAAAHSGKKVLFVAEKMAALNVVYQRMVKVGLSDLCLELHSKTANKKAVLGEIGMTLSKSSSIVEAQSVDEDLTIYRDKLNEISGVLHEVVADRDYSAFSVLAKISRLMGEGVEPPQISLPDLEHLTFSEIDELLHFVKKYVGLKVKYGSYTSHPFLGVQNLDIQPFDVQRLPNEIRNFQRQFSDWKVFASTLADLLETMNDASVNAVAEHVELVKHLRDFPSSDTNLHELLKPLSEDGRLFDGLEATATWASSEKALSEKVADTVWSLDHHSIRSAVAAGTTSWFKRAFGPYRRICKDLQTHVKFTLPHSPSDRLDFVDAIIVAAKEKKLFEAEAGYLSSKLDYAWRGERTEVSELQQVLNWIKKFPFEMKDCSPQVIAKVKATNLEGFVNNQAEELSSNLFGSLDLLKSKLMLDDGSLDVCDQKFQQILDHLSLYPEWTEFHFSRQTLIEKGIEAYLEAHDAKKISDSLLASEIEFAIFEEKWRICQHKFPQLTEISKLDRHKLVSTFSSLEEKKVDFTCKKILQNHLENLPKGAVGEMGLIRGELAKKRRHKSLRYMITHAGNMISRIKPIFLMSPISVAQYLPPEKIEFDLLVIDEASQVRPEDALGSIARAKQIVVVGDQKQLPPTSFFDRLIDNAEAEDVEDESPSIVQAVEMESILSLCEARGMHQSMLEWHYRSRDPSLIMVSNIEFYDSRLILPPSPMAQDSFFGLSLKRVSGAYSSASKGQGRPGTNRIEAEAVVDRLTELASSHPNFSVGIVTFSKSQADMVTEILEFKRRHNSLLDMCLRENKTENVFVKNIENVQGDERDIILISVGYGPLEPNQALSTMNFGPINSDGGERRLNVLFSRSRVACEVYTSFNPADIDPSRTSKEGPKVLKKFLQFAENGFLPALDVSTEEPDSDFEVDVAFEIKKMGYEVDYQVGTAGFRIDIGVRKRGSNNFLLAVECDGATYHSALWARERDRLRQNVLEGFGWKFHRIWSTDWFHRRNAELERLKIVLENCAELEIGTFIKGSNHNAPKIKNEVDTPKLDEIIILETKIEVPKYTKATISVPNGFEPHEQPLSTIMSALYEIVKIEGPIHVNELARRYTTAHGKTKVGSRILSAVKNAVKKCVSNGMFLEKMNFLATQEQFHKVPVRDRSEETTPTTKAEFISKEEIKSCAELITEESGEIPMEELVKAISGVLGFKRTGPDLHERIVDCIVDE